MQTLDLHEAAAFLKIHPVTLQGKAKAGEIPGAKPGKCWVFLDVDLVTWLRSQYNDPGKQDASDIPMEEKPCSLKEKAHPTGIINLRLVEKQYTDLLAPKTKTRRKK